MSSENLKTTPATSPTPSHRGAILYVAIALLLPLIAIAYIVLGGESRERFLQREGIKAKALIVRLQDTGTRYNHNPEVRITLEVHPTGKKPYRTILTEVLSPVDLADYRTDTEVWVRYNREKPTELILLGPKRTPKPTPSQTP